MTKETNYSVEGFLIELKTKVHKKKKSRAKEEILFLLAYIEAKRAKYVKKILALEEEIEMLQDKIHYLKSKEG